MEQEQQFPDAGAIQRLVEETEAEVTSETSAVRVVAGPGGRVKELDLRMNAFQMSGVELGEMIVETMRAAQNKLERELAEAISRETGIELSDGAFGGGLPPVERPEEDTQ